MTDWGHFRSVDLKTFGGSKLTFASAFKFPPTSPTNETFLLNGRGDVRKFGFDNTTTVREPYELTFNKTTEPGKRPKRYLLRVINTSFDTTFIFSIDRHNLTVVSNDFVPIHGYVTNWLLIGIGQRYNVVVWADQGRVIPAQAKADNFWIRLQVASCFGKDHNNYREGYDHAGILTCTPNNIRKPTTNAWSDISFRCADEPMDKLKPIVLWIVGNPKNPFASEKQQVSGRPGIPFRLPNDNNT